MRKTIVIAVLACFAVSGCIFFGPPSIYFIGPQLAVGDGGHFLADVAYHVGTATFVYRADGSFEYTRDAYEDEGDDLDGNGVVAEGWVIVEGQRGTYGYDPQTPELTVSYLQEYGAGEFVDLDAADRFVRVSNTYFGENKFATAYVADPENELSFLMAETIEDEASVDAHTVRFTFNEEAGTFVLSDYEESSDTTGILDADELELSGACLLLPEGVKIRTGNTITARLTFTLMRSRSWDGDAMTSWTEETDQHMETYTFTHMGGFLIEEGETVFRSVLGVATKEADQ